MSHRSIQILLGLLLVVFGVGFQGTVQAASAPDPAPTSPSLRWNSQRDRVDADFDGTPLETVLERLAKESGWDVAYEPGLDKSVSARFKDVSVDRALALLFASLSYTVVPQTNSVPRLLVFGTSKDLATRVVPRIKKKTGRIENELVVKVKPGTDIDALARSLGAKVVGRDDEHGVYRLRFEDAAAADAAAEALAQNPDVLGIDHNFWMENPIGQNANPATAGSGAFDLEFKAPENGGCNVVVALIDTPIKPFNDARDQFILPSISVVGGQADNGADLTHSPAMASTILSSIASKTRASSVQILPVDVYGNSETTTTFDVAQGIAKAVTSGANILNLSLGSSGDSAFLHQVIQQATSQGVLVFAAAGNQPTSAATYPAAYSEVTAVTAGTRSGDIASYANHGSFVDVIAPGSSQVHWNGQSYTVSGTSAATAYVSGLAAAQADPCDPAFSTLGQRIATSLAPK